MLKKMLVISIIILTFLFSKVRGPVKTRKKGYSLFFAGLDSAPCDSSNYSSGSPVGKNNHSTSFSCEVIKKSIFMQNLHKGLGLLNRRDEHFSILLLPLLRFSYCIKYLKWSRLIYGPRFVRK